MFDQILKLLKAPEPNAASRDELQTAVAVLLIEAASMDDTFGPDERTAIERLLAVRFGLAPGATSQLLAHAEARAVKSNQIHPFTRTAVERMTPQARIGLIEMLWEVAYADGVLDPEEDLLLRRISGLIYVSDSDRIAARQRVLQRMSAKN